MPEQKNGLRTGAATRIFELKASTSFVGDKAGMKRYLRQIVNASLWHVLFDKAPLKEVGERFTFFCCKPLSLSPYTLL